MICCSAAVYAIGELHACHGPQLAPNASVVLAAIIKKHCKSSEVTCVL